MEAVLNGVLSPRDAGIPIYRQASIKALTDYYIIGVNINFSKRSVEMVRNVAGILLILYVGTILMAGMLSRDVLNQQTVDGIQATLDLPAGIALVAFSVLSIKLEVEKPRHRNLQKSRDIVDVLLIAFGAVLIFGLIYIQYFM